MRKLTYYTEKPKKRDVIVRGNRASVFVRTDIKSNNVIDMDGKERKEWTAIEYSAIVCSPRFEMTDEFAEKLIADETEKAAKEIRQKRNRLLEESDSEMLIDRLEKQTEEYIRAIKEYRQKLRDISKQKGFPFDVEFPVKPQ